MTVGGGCQIGSPIASLLLQAHPDLPHASRPAVLNPVRRGRPGGERAQTEWAHRSGASRRTAPTREGGFAAPGRPTSSFSAAVRPRARPGSRPAPLALAPPRPGPVSRGAVPASRPPPFASRAPPARRRGGMTGPPTPEPPRPEALAPATDARPAPDAADRRAGCPSRPLRQSRSGPARPPLWRRRTGPSDHVKREKDRASERVKDRPLRVTAALSYVCLPVCARASPPPSIPATAPTPFGREDPRDTRGPGRNGERSRGRGAPAKPRGPLPARNPPDLRRRGRPETEGSSREGLGFPTSAIPSGVLRGRPGLVTSPLRPSCLRRRHRHGDYLSTPGIGDSRPGSSTSQPYLGSYGLYFYFE